MVAYYVYMLTSGKNGTIYTGVTNDLLRRVYEHKTDAADSFTMKYNVKDLVWYEVYDQIETAIAREKQIKNWQRQWKIELICERNPN